MAPVAPVIPTINLKSQTPNPESQIPNPNAVCQSLLPAIQPRSPRPCDLEPGVWDLGFGISLKAIIDFVFRRQRSGSVICTSCGVLVGVDDDRCYNCNRWNPGLWGWAPALRALGNDLGFVPFVIGACGFVYVLAL